MSHTTAKPRGSQPDCPLCREALSGEPYVCPGCETQYHADCASELGGCSVLGCERREAVVLEPGPDPLQRQLDLDHLDYVERLRRWEAERQRPVETSREERFVAALSLAGMPLMLAPCVLFPIGGALGWTDRTVVAVWFAVGCGYLALLSLGSALRRGSRA